MSNIEKIKAEIERRKKICEGIFERESDTYYQGKAVAYGELLSFVNSRPEEKPSEDLNKLIQKWDRIDINTVLKVKVKATGKVIDGFYDGRGHFDHFIDHDVFDRYSIDEVELMPDEESSEELEEAAENYIAPIENDEGLDYINFNGRNIKDAFIAGAEWMRKKDVEDMYMSDNRHFLKCYEQGKVDMKVEIMKDAVEGYVTFNCDAQEEGLPCATVIANEKPMEFYENRGFKLGDKVKMIIVKED